MKLILLRNSRRGTKDHVKKFTVFPPSWVGSAEFGASDENCNIVSLILMLVNIFLLAFFLGEVHVIRIL